MARDIKLGLIARMDKSGLGIGQTRRLARLLNPDSVMIIDSTNFNGADQFPDWYSEYNSMIIRGFPTDQQIELFLEDIDIVISCETFYHNHFTMMAKTMNVKTILIANPEFCDWYRPEWWSIPKPDKIVVPSFWKFGEMVHQFNAVYYPTPIFDDEFATARKVNLAHKGKPRYLFVNGKTAAHDRNGLESLYAALPISSGNYEMVIKSQGEIKKHPDPRLVYDISDPEDQAELYTGFDALILPRRYAGQCLPMCEALSSCLPVIMTDIDPNNMVLPPEWLVPATKTGEFMTRIKVDIYSADPQELANKLDNPDIFMPYKLRAYEMSQQFDADKLKPKYEELLKW